MIYSKEHKRLIAQIKKARLLAGLTQLEASKSLHKTQSFISKIESGQIRIDVVILKNIAKIYQQPIIFFTE